MRTDFPLPALLPAAGIAGNSVVLRPFSSSDICEQYLAWLNDPQVVRFSNQRFRRHDEKSCRAYLESFSGTDNLFLSVRRSRDDEAIGTLTAHVSRPHETADMGILIGNTEVWGQGLGQDAWNTLLNWLLREAGLRKVTGGTLACNFGMCKLFERSGMSLEATRKAQEIVDGRTEDVLYYAKFNAT